MSTDFNDGNTELFDMVYNTAIQKHMKPTDLSLVGDVLKYDILMYLKAHLSTDKIDNLTAKKFSEVLSYIQSSDQNAFNNGKQKMDDKYLEKLSKIDMPFYYPAIYYSTDAKANPYGRLIKNITFKDFIEYKDTLNAKANSYISKINDQTTKANESIVNTYYLESTYGFSLKTDLANHFAQNYIVPDIYDKDLIKKIKQKVICGMLSKGSGDKGVITKSDIDDILHMLNGKEQRFLLDVINAKQPHSKLSLNDFEDTKDRTVRAGFLKMYLEYAKRVCEEYQKVLSFFDFRNNSHLYEFSVVTYNQDYTKLIINLIDQILVTINFSSLDDKRLTNIENLLISFSHNYDYGKIQTTNEALEKSKDHHKRINAKITINGIEFDTDDTESIEKYADWNICTGFFEENNDYNNFLLMIQSFLKQNNNEKVPPKDDKHAMDLAAKIKKLMDNCFNKPFEARSDNNFLISCQKLPHLLDTNIVRHNISGFQLINNLKCIMIKKKLLKELICLPYYSQKEIEQWFEPQDYIEATIKKLSKQFDYVIDDILKSLYSKFSDNNECVSSYIQSIYNKSLVEYINNSGLNETMLPEIINKLDDKTMDEIIRLVVDNKKWRSS